MISIDRKLASLTPVIYMCFSRCQFLSSKIIADLGFIVATHNWLNLVSDMSLSLMKIMLCIYSGRSEER